MILLSGSLYHKNQFYRSFSGGSPPAAGRAIRSNCLEAISATIPNPYASSRPNCICTTNSHRQPLTARLRPSAECGRVIIHTFLAA